MKFFLLITLIFMPIVARAVCPEDKPEVIPRPQVENIESLNDAVDGASFSAEELLYQQIKRNFLASDFCNPIKMFSSTGANVNPFFIRGVADSIKSKISKFGVSLEEKYAFINSLRDEFSLSEDDLKSVRELIQKSSQTSVGTGLMPTVATGKLIQLILKSALKNPEKTRDRTVQQLVDAHVFEKGAQSKVVCPFPSKDAFLKAFEGYQKLKNLSQMGVTNLRYLTLVDYTKPSNQRRLFVIDLQKNEVVNNTWVAQGAGLDGASASGTDGLGSNPAFSNKNGSNLSSDGFIVADSKLTPSPKFEGNRIQLNGVDLNNSLIRNPRGVEIHSHGTPAVSFLNDAEKNLEKFLATELPQKNDNAFLGASEKMVSSFLQSVSYSSLLPSTEGCLGVPGYELENKPGTLGNQILGGVIFSYSGKKMTSKYFE